MRPIQLTMNAFGSYAEKAEINFDLFGKGGLLLITGDTGSGKTTIFDAITFALFNKTSGENREVNTLRSDLASEREETYVRLIFSHKGRQYEIYRSPQYRKARKDGTGFTMKPAKAMLIREPEPPIEGSRQVDEAVAELLKIDYDQYKQISMLAQGEFRRLLTAGTAKRGEILQKIFNTEKYERLGVRMAERCQAVAAQMEELYNRIDQYFEGVDCGDDSRNFAAMEEQKKILHTERSRYQMEERMRLLHDVIAEDGAHISRQEEIFREKRRIAEERARIHTLVQADSALFEKYDKLMLEKDALAGKREEMNCAEALLQKQKKAFYEVAPFQRAFEGEQEKLQTAEKAHADAADALETAKTAYTDAADAFRQAEGRIAEAETKKKQAALLEQKEADYERRDQLDREITACNEKILELREQWETQTKEMEALQERMVREKEKLRRLENVPQEVFRMEMECSLLEERLERCRELLEEKLPQLVRDRENYQKAQDHFRAVRERYDEKNLAYQTSERLLEESRAGILATRLEEGKACPVCGSTRHPAPASLPQEVMTEEALQEEKSALAELEEEKNRAHRSAVAAGTKFEAEHKNIYEGITRVLGLPEEAEEWEPERIRTEGYAEYEARQSEKERKERQLRQLQLAQRELEQGKESLEEDNEKLKNLSQCREQIRDVLEQTQASAAHLQGQWKEMQGLAYADLKEAVAARRKLEQEAKTLLEAVELRREEHVAAGNTLSACESAAAACEKQMEEQKAGLTLKEQAYREAVTKAGFSDREEFRQALTEEAVLIEKEEALTRYRTDVAVNEAALYAAEQNIEGKVRPEEERAAREAKESREEELAVQECLNQLRNRREHNREILDNIREKGSQVEEKLRKAGVLKHLADALQGKKKGTAKTSFETWAQMAGLDQILHAANRRLLPISGGQYQLYRHEDPDARRNVGLDLDILATNTGKKRSVKTLSGGESFMASLSLALGLSDHVTANAGGIQMDTLFIDEGFGTLDEKSLHDAIEMLKNISAGDKLIGLISHREELKEVIPRKLIIRKDDRGSHVETDLGV